METLNSYFIGKVWFFNKCGAHAQHVFLDKQNDAFWCEEHLYIIGKEVQVYPILDFNIITSILEDLVMILKAIEYHNSIDNAFGTWKQNWIQHFNSLKFTLSRKIRSKEIFPAVESAHNIISSFELFKNDPVVIKYFEDIAMKFLRNETIKIQSRKVLDISTIKSNLIKTLKLRHQKALDIISELDQQVGNKNLKIEHLKMKIANLKSEFSEKLAEKNKEIVDLTKKVEQSEISLNRKIDTIREKLFQVNDSEFEFKQDVLEILKSFVNDGTYNIVNLVQEASVRQYEAKNEINLKLQYMINLLKEWSHHEDLLNIMECFNLSPGQKLTKQDLQEISQNFGTEIFDGDGNMQFIWNKSEVHRLLKTLTHFKLPAMGTLKFQYLQEANKFVNHFLSKCEFENVESLIFNSSNIVHKNMLGFITGDTIKIESYFPSLIRFSGQVHKIMTICHARLSCEELGRFFLSFKHCKQVGLLQWEFGAFSHIDFNGNLAGSCIADLYLVGWGDETRSNWKKNPNQLVALLKALGEEDDFRNTLQTLSIKNCSVSKVFVENVLTDLGFMNVTVFDK